MTPGTSRPACLAAGACCAVILLIPAIAQDSSGTALLPIWAYPVATAAGRGAPPAPQPAAATADAPKHLPGTSISFTSAQLRDLFNVPDWFPDSHPVMPEVVSQGRKPAVRACGYCHLPNGQGRPENAGVAGLPAEYIMRQMADFKEGLRKSSEARMGSVNLMVQIAKATTDEENKAAAAYFASVKFKPWIRVVETDSVPVTRISGGMLVLVDDGGKEPIGNRVIEAPENLERTELRDSTSGFIAYVPSGSIKRGEELVMTGGNGKTLRCAICHGADLKGLGYVPSIAGRSPSQMTRQIIDIRTGARNGPMTQLMKEAVAKLTNEDIVAIVAYLASRAP